jgi:hypothetical protein
MTARVLWAVPLCCAVLLLMTPAALADGDPASDVLLGQDIFYSYNPPPSPALEKTLNAEVAAARRVGFPVKVALIRSTTDLGLIPDLFGRPQTYARFLGLEISRQWKGPLLVVMAAGYGVNRIPAAAQSAVSALPKPAGAHIDDLVRAATAAIARIAAASGHSIGSPSAWSGEGGSSGASGMSSAVIAATAAAATVVVIGAMAAVRRRRAAHNASRR